MTPRAGPTGREEAAFRGDTDRVLAHGRDFRRWSLVAVLLVATLVYANAVANGYTLDDRGVILKNPLVQSIRGLWLGWVHSYWPESLPGGQYRPLVIASFSIDWALSGGDPRWLHAVNVLWHAAVCGLVWLLAAELLSPAGALAAALVFAVHPVHVEAVANTVGRAEVMAAAFVLLALLVHRHRHWSAIPLFALALASKENGIVFLGLAVAHDVLLETAPREALRRRRWLHAGYLGVAVLYAATLAVIFHGREFVVPAPIWHGVSTTDRLLTVAAVVPEYLRLLLAPASLAVDYNPRVIDIASSATPAVWLGLTMTAALLGVAVVARRRFPVVTWALVFFAIAIAPVSNVLFPSGVVLAERTLYLPSVSIALLAGVATEALARRGTAAALAPLLVVVSAFALRTWTRTPVWHDNKIMVLTALQEHPESYRVHASAATTLALTGKWAGARREFRTARELFDHDARLYRASAEAVLADTASGAARFAEARALLDSALALEPRNGAAHLRQADVLYQSGAYPAALSEARQALRLAPDSVRAAVVVGEAARQLGDIDAAEAGYRSALRRHPEAWELHTGLADVLLGRGDTLGAIREGDLGVSLSSGNPVALAVRLRAGPVSK
jgi:tetratricopeptide (TPR) repeat protein